MTIQIQRYKLYVATSTSGSAGPFGDQRFAFAWGLEDEDGKIVDRDSNPFGEGGKGDHTKGTFPAIRAGVSKLNGVQVDVVTSQEYAANLLNQPANERRARGYRKSNGKALADRDELSNLDAELELRQIAMAGRSPTGLIEANRLNSLHDWAYQKAKFGDATPSDWGI